MPLRNQVQRVLWRLGRGRWSGRLLARASAGTLDGRVGRTLKNRDRARRRIWTLIDEVQQNPSLADAERRRLLRVLLGSLGPDEVPSRFMANLHGHQVGVSYTAQLVELMHLKRRLGRLGYRIAPGNVPKTTQRELAQALGLPTTETLERGVSFDELVLRPGTVVKPVAASFSRGVFLVDPDLHLVSLKDGRRYDDKEAARESIPPALTAQEWLVETAVLGPDGRPAHDIKVFVFYGVVGLVLETARWAGPEAKDLYCYYDKDLVPVDLGRKRVTTFPGTGVPPVALERAVRVSLEVPVPLLRVDFLKGVDEVVLGEITPHPGGELAGNIDREHDRRLGGLFLDARARLSADLLDGKSFDTYFAVYGGRAPQRPVKG